jgi:hypothetical protein
MKKLNVLFILLLMFVLFASVTYAEKNKPFTICTLKSGSTGVFLTKTGLLEAKVRENVEILLESELNDEAKAELIAILGGDWSDAYMAITFLRNGKLAPVVVHKNDVIRCRSSEDELHL